MDQALRLLVSPIRRYPAPVSPPSRAVLNAWSVRHPSPALRHEVFINQAAIWQDQFEKIQLVLPDIQTGV